MRVFAGIFGENVVAGRSFSHDQLYLAFGRLRLLCAFSLNLGICVMLWGLNLPLRRSLSPLPRLPIVTGMHAQKLFWGLFIVRFLDMN